jgi:hypothetical protein
MAFLRDKGLLNVTTVKEFVDYQRALELVELEVLPDGSLKVTNNGKTEIMDLSLVLKATEVLINNQVPEQKTVDEELIFWFNLGAGESKMISVKN